MKTILVIDKPKNCEECFACINIQNFMAMCVASGQKLKVSEMDLLDGGCPLRPLPSQKYLSLKDEHDDIIFQMGWNACIDEILGETE